MFDRGDKQRSQWFCRESTTAALCFTQHAAFLCILCSALFLDMLIMLYCTSKITFGINLFLPSHLELHEWKTSCTSVMF